jgi:hypothetical protein
MNAGHLQGGCNVDAADARVCEGRTHEAAVQGIGQVDVIDEAALTTEVRSTLWPTNAPAAALAAAASVAATCGGGAAPRRRAAASKAASMMGW